MKVLYLLRSGMDETVSGLIERHGKSNEAEVIDIAAGQINYRELVEKIFDADKVISW